MGILVDSREKSNIHIIEHFDKYKIPYKKMKLDQGDYSFYVPAQEHLNIDRDLHFHHHIKIERKNSLDEIAQNFTKDRARIKTEFAQYKGEMILLIENASYEKLCKGEYRSQYNSKSFLASLHSMSAEYNIPFLFIEDIEYVPVFIYYHFYYYLRNIIK